MKQHKYTILSEEEWEHIANTMAREQTQIVECKQCKYPRRFEYCCLRCGED